MSGLMSDGRGICLVGTEDGPVLPLAPILDSTGLDEPRIDRGARGGITLLDWFAIVEGPGPPAAPLPGPESLP
jgi:hypothetical protein